MLVTMRSDQLPLCPNTMSPVHPLHAFHVNIQDAASSSAEHDEDNQFTHEAASKMYSAISDQLYDGRMRLYMDSNFVFTLRKTVEVWYYRCTVCGLVLPAVAKDFG